MIRDTEIELHARAQKQFEIENPGRFWRCPDELRQSSVPSDRIAGLIERQTFLAKVRDQMRQEGISLETEEDPPSAMPSG